MAFDLLDALSKIGIGKAKEQTDEESRREATQAMNSVENDAAKMEIASQMSPQELDKRAVSMGSLADPEISRRDAMKQSVDDPLQNPEPVVDPLLDLTGAGAQGAPKGSTGFSVASGSSKLNKPVSATEALSTLQPSSPPAPKDPYGEYNLAALHDAITKRDGNNKLAMLMENANRAVSGSTGAALNTSVSDALKKSANNGIEDIGTARKLIDQDTARDETLLAAGEKAAQRDVNSSVSSAARDLVKNMYKNLGTALPVDISSMSAQQLEKTFPMIKEDLGNFTKKLVADRTAEYQKLSLQNSNAKSDKNLAFRDNKQTNADWAKFSKEANTLSASARNAAGRAAGSIAAAQAIEALTNGKDPDKLTRRQIVELVKGLDRMVTGGQATVSGTEKLMPNTWKGDFTKTSEYILNQAKPAEMASFVQEILGATAREKMYNVDKIKQATGAVAEGYLHLLEKDPVRFNSILARQAAQGDITQGLAPPKPKTVSARVALMSPQQKDEFIKAKLKNKDLLESGEATLEELLDEMEGM